MGLKIYKYILRPELLHHSAKFIFQIPGFQKVLCVHKQREDYCIWVQIDSEVTLIEPHVFYIIGTGQKPMDFDGDLTAPEYIGTIQQNQWVWHVYYGGISNEG